MALAVDFPSDYATSREQFRLAVEQLRWATKSHAIDAVGPDGEELTVDVAWSPNGNADRVLVISSGVHGVEGFFGAAVQLALLRKWLAEGAPAVKCLFLHALNPYGFAWLRRFDESNIDPNRNFLLPSETFSGAPADYAELDPFLNPRRPPSRMEPFTVKAAGIIAKYGMPALRKAVAVGQYEFPKGLFFGGNGPSTMNRLLDANLGRWLEGSQQVVHLDFHTGLGAYASYKLLIDYPLSQRQHSQLTDWFGADAFEALESEGTAYTATGGFGRWCQSREFANEYLFAFAEFGTYSPVKVLGGLRAENQAHHWGEPNKRSTIRAKQRLKELFCPAADAWRTKVLKQSVDLVEQAIKGLINQ